MVDRFFLALDYHTPREAVQYGMGALDTLEALYGPDFVREHVGVKINQDLVETRDPSLRLFGDRFNGGIFADMKIAHGASTGKRIMRGVAEHLPFDYVTVSAVLGRDILKRYVEAAAEHDAGVIAWTVHTKTSPGDAMIIYRRSVSDVIYNLAQMSGEAGCAAAVMEAGRLEEERIRELPIRKLVTGIRIDPEDKGEQSRVSALGQLAQCRNDVAFVVVSSRYLNDPESLQKIFDSLR